MELIHESLKGDSLCAREVSAMNKVNAYVYAAAIRELLTLGGGKFRNIIIPG